MSFDKGNSLKIKNSFETKILEDQFDLIKDVLEEYGDKSGYHLENLSHSQLPWIEKLDKDLSQEKKVII